MVNIHQKTLDDLEFPTVLQQAADLCITDLGKDSIFKISPFKDKTKIELALVLVKEFMASFENDNRIPNHGFTAITNELQLFNIENSTIEVSGFNRLLALSKTTELLLKFFKKYDEFYVNLNTKSQAIDFDLVIVKEIGKIIDRFGIIKDSATPELKFIRSTINAVKGKIGASFVSALSNYTKADYLDDIRETVIDNRRVLAVKSMYRKKIMGSVMGSSKTGSIVYIEPEATLKYSRELNNLEFDEQEEITRILKDLTNFLRPYSYILKNYQDYLSKIDVIYAKAKYAVLIEGILPRISANKTLFLKNAYHPLLFLNNKKTGTKTYPQTIKLDPKNRITVISGPNAGGKSITLKTIGLLQIMLQSGFLIPVHPHSELCLFDRLLTDIGDNQSIENQLSTYSYRLKKMNQFLKKCNPETLFLIDEFGTGSDPELGGALAEIFLEVFYEREAYGVITTHYTNLKLLANELDYATNANMQFDTRSLEPMYKLQLGEAGSSFTFEVAQKNGIPYSLINRAKKKIEGGKVRFDKSLANMQIERSKLRKTSESLKTKEQKVREESIQLESINTKIKEKLENFQELYDTNQRYIALGKKIDALSESYFNNGSKKQLMDELFKMAAIESAKKKKVSVKEKKAAKIKKHEVTQEVEQKVAVIRKRKKKEKAIAKRKPADKPKIDLKVGDVVRLIDGKALGSIDRIEKKKATVNYGIFITEANLEQLELVERK